MPRNNVGAGCFRDPFPPECCQIGDPHRKILDMARHVIAAEATGPGLPAPVRSGHAPAVAVPAVQGFEVFFVIVAPTRHEQDRATCSLARNIPVYPPDRMAIRRLPHAFAGGVGDGAPVEGGEIDRGAVDRGAVEGSLVHKLIACVANAALRAVVTIW